MLEDRDYMRQPEYNEPRWTPRFRFQWSWTVVLLAAYAAVFIAELAAQKFFPGNNFFQGHAVLTGNGVEFSPAYLPLSVEGLEHGFVWQLMTYQFLHLACCTFWNSWVIYVFGREMESVLGGRKFLALMFSSGIVGGVFQVLVALVWPQYFGGPVVGASACAFGLVAAYAMMFPERELTLLIFFIIPVHLRAKTLLIGSAVLARGGIFLSQGHHARHGPRRASRRHGDGLVFCAENFAGRLVAAGRRCCIRQKNCCRRRPSPEPLEKKSRRRFRGERGGSHPGKNFRARHPEPHAART